MQLDEFYDYKNKVLDDLLTNENILKLLDDNLEVADAGKLMYKQVFPFEYIPETVEHGRTFICCDVDLIPAGENLNRMIYKPVLYIWVFTHKDLLRLPNGGGVRTDKLAHEVAKKLCGSRYYGMGELTLYSVKRFAPMMDYQGKAIVFHARDWNMPRPNRQPIPANRKTG